MRRAFLLGALLWACQRAPEPSPQKPPAPQGPQPPESVEEKEPNDYQRPQQLPARAVVAGALKREERWFRVGPAQGETLSVELTAQNAEMEISDRDHNPLLHTRAPAFLPQVACEQSCFLKLSGASGPYKLTVLAGPPPADQELEPNNRAVDANALAPGKRIGGTLYDADDQDWYRLPLPPPKAGQFIRVEVTPVEGVQPVLEVRAPDDGALLATFTARAVGEGLSLRDLSMSLALRPAAEPADAGLPDAGADAGVADGGPPDAGTASAPALNGYSLVVKSAKGSNARAGYLLSATIEDGPADIEQEPNDDPQHATPAQQTASGYLAPAGDRDFYRVHADAASVLHVELSGVPRTDLELLAVSADGGVLAHVNEGGTKEGETLPAVGVPPGDVFVEVRAAPKDGADPDHLYKLSFTLSPDDGSIEREPNNDLASAQTLSLPIEVKGWIWPRKDVDLFRFHVPPEHAPVSAVVSAVRGVDLQLRLYEIHGTRMEVIGSSDSVRGEGEEKLVSVPLKEGDFAVEISSPRNKDASATQAYTLSVQ
jgi:hypothetical protein